MWTLRIVMTPLPPKQGLKHLDEPFVRTGENRYDTTSTKTRIETLLSVDVQDCRTELWHHFHQNKDWNSEMFISQNLLSLRYDTTSTKTRIETTLSATWAPGRGGVMTPLPPKQGLKQFLIFQGIQPFVVMTPLPPKQGLKPIWRWLVEVERLVMTPLPPKQGLKLASDNP